MATDKKSHFLVTGDVDGLIKVWNIMEYCIHAVEDIITEPPREYLRQLDVVFCWLQGSAIL